MFSLCVMECSMLLDVLIEMSCRMFSLNVSYCFNPNPALGDIGHISYVDGEAPDQPVHQLSVS